MPNEKPEVIRFTVNEPVTVVLRSAGTQVESKWNGEQYHYKLADNRSMYVSPIVYRKLMAQNVCIGDTVTICKRERTPGDGASIVWDAQVETPAATPLATQALPSARLPQPAAQLLDRVQSIDGIPDQPAKKPMTRLEHALKTALDAIKAAEEYSEQIGRPMRFDKDDARLMATTLVINAEKGRAA